MLPLVVVLLFATEPVRARFKFLIARSAVPTHELVPTLGCVLIAGREGHFMKIPGRSETTAGSAASKSFSINAGPIAPVPGPCGRPCSRPNPAKGKGTAICRSLRK
jgi:hypothetical protein